jgi:DNA-binding transcriptional MerR regulator
MTVHPGAEYTIDELARTAGVTVRSVRVYHERGVLPPPVVRGRTGYYGPPHLARLRAIGRLLERGMKLAGIKSLFDAWDRGEGLAEVLGFVDQVATPYHASPATTVTRDELRQYGTDRPANLERAIALGVYEATDDTETYRVVSPRLSRFGAALVGAGLPVERALAELERLKDDCDRIAARHAALFDEVVWEPYKVSRRTPDDLARVTAYLAVTRRMPTEAASELIALALQRTLAENTPELLDVIGEGATGA